MSISRLDLMLSNQSEEKLLQFFSSILKSNTLKAISMLNEDNLSFRTYFVIMPLILQQENTLNLNARNITAMRIFNECFTNQKQKEIIKEDINTLKWITKDCLKFDGENDAFDQMMDYCLGRQISDYKNVNALEITVDLLYQRARRDEFYHDLVWEIFKFGSAEVLEIISKHLNSNNDKEKLLTNELLENLIDDDPEENQSIIKHMGAWLQENKPYIEFYEDGFNSSSKPNFCKVNHIAKYRGKPCKSGGFYLPTSQKDADNEKIMRSLDRKSQACISCKSYMLRNKDMDKWCKWKCSNAYLDMTNPKDNWEV